MDEGHVSHSGHGRGLTILSAAFFIVGEIAGSGVLALPRAVEDTGWIGLVLIIFCAFLSSYTGAILGESWIIIQERFPEYREHCPNPYPVLGEKTFGKAGRYIVSFSINFTLFGVSTVFLLIASENIHDLIKRLGHSDESFCMWLAILAVVICPFTWFGTPAEFWPVAVGATGATALACILLIINIGIDSSKNHDHVLHSKTEFEPFFMAFGTIVFAFGGHPAFPTFQTDMKIQKQFRWAVLLGYMVVMVMYLPVAGSSYFVYGKKVSSNVLLTVSDGGLNDTVEILITAHLLLGLLIVINPFCQELESYCKVPRHFTWKRCVFRSAMVAIILFVAETIPKFGAILSLVGGSTVTLLAYVCPSLFYLRLKSVNSEDLIGIVDSQDNPSTVNQVNEISVPLWVKVMNILIIILGAVAGIASTYSAIKSIASPDSFTVPCYVNATAASS